MFNIANSFQKLINNITYIFSFFLGYKKTTIYSRPGGIERERNIYY